MVSADRRVLAWWACLSALAMINIAAWAMVVATGDRSWDDAQVVLSGLYVAGCAYRCFLPVFDIPRIGLVDSWASSVLVGRSVATIAELAFAAQWAVHLHGSELVGVRWAALLILPIIVAAEIFSWHAVLTTSNRGHIVENSLWGIASGVIVSCLVAVAIRVPEERTLALGAWTLGGVLFTTYIFIVDVPMYRARWKSDLAARRRFLSLAQGFTDLRERRVVSRRWEDWRGEIVWMTLYFSVGVWVSISLVS